MDQIIFKYIFQNWQQKLIALFLAIIIWFYVNQTIIETKTLLNVPIRIEQIPANKTMLGLQPNNVLGKRMALTLSGTKDVIRNLESGDLEVRINASLPDQDEWVAEINIKNLKSLNPSIVLKDHITSIQHAALILKLVPRITEKIPLQIKYPTGTPPEGYEFLDTWPQILSQTISGPEEEIIKLRQKGLQIRFDLNQISKEDLDLVQPSTIKYHDDEISYPVPKSWKRIQIPFRDNISEPFNDPDAEQLYIDFLRKKLLPLEKEVPLHIFYPSSTLDKLNPQTQPLEAAPPIIEKNGIFLLTTPLYVREVSQRFLDVIRNNIEIVVIATPPEERETLLYSIEILDPQELEDQYVLQLMTTPSKERELILRRRFKDYVERMRLYTSPTTPLKITPILDKNKIIIATYAD